MAAAPTIVCQQISSDAEALASLHASVGWTPRDIRPTPAVRAARCDFLDETDRAWVHPSDSVLSDVFRVRSAPSAADPGCRKIADAAGVCALRPLERRLIAARFPYDCPPGTVHCCLWFFLGIGTDRAERPLDVDINAALEDELRRFIASGAPRAAGSSIEAVWYGNPKPSVEDGRLFHVQVFWHWL